MKDISAFPSENKYEGEVEGMTLRDYFAAKAMQGMVTANVSIDIDKDYPFQTRAATAYMIADAMIKEREK